MSTTRRIVVAAAALSMVALAACSTSSSPKSSDSSSPASGGGSTSGQLTASATGVTADTIKLAFTYPDLESLAKSGLVKVSHGSYPDVIKVLVDDINANGGINGRKLDVIPEKFGVVAASDMLAACTKVTEDEKVFMVLGGFTNNDANLCVTEQHATPMLSTFGSGFNQAIVGKAKAPWATPAASDERGVKALVQVLKQQGSLEGKTIGVYGGSASSKPLVDLTNETLKAAGYTVKDSAINDAEATDGQAVTAQDKLIGQKFKDDGVDTVFVLFSIPPGANFDAIGYHPAMYSPQSGLVSAGAFTNPYAKFPIVGALGSTTDPDQGYNSPEMQRCRDLWTKATGKIIKTPTQESKDGKSSSFTAMSTVCTALRIFVDAAKAAGPNLTPQTWEQGLQSLGSIQVASGTTTSFGPNKPDGQDSFVLQKYNPAWKSGSDVLQMLPVGNVFTFTG
jgi:branched-chain amino acid transport system substrate-binding protein